MNHTAVNRKSKAGDIRCRLVYISSFVYVTPDICHDKYQNISLGSVICKCPIHDYTKKN